MQAKAQTEDLINFKPAVSDQYMPLPPIELITLSNDLKNKMKQQLG